VLGVSFGEDASTVRKDNAPQNLSLFKKIVLNLIRLDTTDQKKASLRLKGLLRFAWNRLGATTPPAEPFGRPHP